MLKVGTKRRRTTEQVKTEREEARIKEQTLQDRLVQIQRTEQELNNEKGAADILTGFIKQGLVKQDPDGSFSVPSASKQRPQPKKEQKDQS